MPCAHALHMRCICVAYALHTHCVLVKRVATEFKLHMQHSVLYSPSCNDPHGGNACASVVRAQGTEKREQYLQRRGCTIGQVRVGVADGAQETRGPNHPCDAPASQTEELAG
jgi:hypothetical protein